MKRIVGIVFTVLFLLWFAASIWLINQLLNQSGTGGWILAAVGQYFFVFGVVGLISRISYGYIQWQSLLPGFMIVLFGAVMVTIGIIISLGQEEVIRWLYPFLTLLILSIQPLSGLCLLLYWYYACIVTKRKCCQEVSAVCIKYKTSIILYY